MTPDLSAARRTRELDLLAAGHEVDVLVVGGGITGVGVALDAASRGLSVALVERGDLAQRGRRTLRRVHQIEHHVGVAERLERGAAHRLVQRVSRLEQAGRVEHHHLRVVAGVDADHPIARGLRLRARDGELLADDAVEERRLAGVRLADHGDDPGAGHGRRVSGGCASEDVQRGGAAPRVSSANARLARRSCKHETPAPSKWHGGFGMGAGDGLLSRVLSDGVPSALSGLTTVFGMGTGVALTL